MKKFWKALALVGCALLLVVASVAGTYAILKSEASVTNTFTAGNVSITLDETDYDVYGLTKVADDPVTTNEYKLIPCHEYKKDPTIHVAANSEDCYLFVKIENGISTIEADTIAGQLTANRWVPLDGVDNVYYRDSIVASSATVTNVPVFTTFTIKDVDVSNYVTATNANAIIKVTAYAAQADGFGTAAAAWSAANFS